LSILEKVAPSSPKNVTYINHKIQNFIIEVISMQVAEHIVEEKGYSFSTIKMDGVAYSRKDIPILSKDL